MDPRQRGCALGEKKRAGGKNSGKRAFSSDQRDVRFGSLDDAPVIFCKLIILLSYISSSQANFGFISINLEEEHDKTTVFGYIMSVFDLLRAVVGPKSVLHGCFEKIRTIQIQSPEVCEHEKIAL